MRSRIRKLLGKAGGSKNPVLSLTERLESQGEPTHTTVSAPSPGLANIDLYLALAIGIWLNVPQPTQAGYPKCTKSAGPWHAERYSDEFARLCRQAGVPVIRLHDVRHTTNSLLAAAGVPDHIRAAWCGHTVAVNVSMYTHARPEDMALAAMVLAGILSGE